MLTSLPCSLRYDVALLYLEQSDWNLEEALMAYREDEQWEKSYPLEAHSQANKGKGVVNSSKRRFLGRD